MGFESTAARNAKPHEWQWLRSTSQCMAAVACSLWCPMAVDPAEMVIYKLTCANSNLHLPPLVVVHGSAVAREINVHAISLRCIKNKLSENKASMTVHEDNWTRVDGIADRTRTEPSASN